MSKSFHELKKKTGSRLRETFEQILGKGKTYTERDFEMFKLGWAFYEDQEKNK